MSWRTHLGLPGRFLLLTLLLSRPGLASCRLSDLPVCAPKATCCSDEQTAADLECCRAADLAGRVSSEDWAAFAPATCADHEPQPCLCLRGQFPAPPTRRGLSRPRPDPERALAIHETATFGPVRPSVTVAATDAPEPKLCAPVACSSPRSPPHN